MNLLRHTLFCACLLGISIPATASVNSAQQRQILLDGLLQATEGPAAELNREANLRLMAVDEHLRPVYYELHNIDAARTSGVDQLYNGGSLGMDFSGDRIDWLGVWDGGRPYEHVEFSGRYMQRDYSSLYANHMTHVAGTMIATGLDPQARGMAWAAPRLNCWDWMGDLGELLGAGQSELVLVSNHSYGVSAGWYRSGGNWYWYGDTAVSEEEDWKFGAYTSDSNLMDVIAAACPRLLQVRSAGNHPGQQGPEPGGEHFVFVDMQWQPSTVTRQPDGGEEGYDSIDYAASAKNVLTVGNVLDVANWPPAPEDIVRSSSSGCGPVDDGRIKPDLCANGSSLYSTYSSSNGYARLSGTSMAAPVVASVAAMLQQLYLEGHLDESELRDGEILRSASLRGLLCHTAREAGDAPGPDYRFGWGLLDAEAAASLLQRENESLDVIHERILSEASADTLQLIVTQENPRVTLCWTDPAAEAQEVELNSSALRLVNDLDLRIHSMSGETWSPWILDPLHPEEAASTGDNFRDNIEVCNSTLAPGDTCLVVVSHKGTLEGNAQEYSLILDGLASMSNSHFVLESPPPIAGDTIELALMLEEGQAFSALTLSIPFDENLFELLSLKNGQVFATGPQSSTLPGGGVQLQWESDELLAGWSGERELLHLTLRARHIGEYILQADLEMAIGNGGVYSSLQAVPLELHVYGESKPMPCSLVLEPTNQYSRLGDYIFLQLKIGPVNHLGTLHMRLEMESGLEFVGAWNYGYFDRDLSLIQNEDVIDLVLSTSEAVSLCDEESVAGILLRRSSIQTFSLEPSAVNLYASVQLLQFQAIIDVVNLHWQLAENLPEQEPADSIGLPEQLIEPRPMRLQSEELRPID